MATAAIPATRNGARRLLLRGAGRTTVASRVAGGGASLTGLVTKEIPDSELGLPAGGGIASMDGGIGVAGGSRGGGGGTLGRGGIGLPYLATTPNGRGSSARITLGSVVARTSTQGSGGAIGACSMTATAGGGVSEG
jgi:hypothetical protein